MPRTRNGGQWTDAMFYSAIRSALRARFRFWKPATEALALASRPSQSKNKRLKKEYRCAACGKWFPRKDVEIDHVEPCGSLRSLEDVASFIERLTPEDPKAFQIVCKPCHKRKTQAERIARK